MGPIALIFTFRRRTRVTCGSSRILDRSGPSSATDRSKRPVASRANDPVVELEQGDPHTNGGPAIIVGVGPGFGYALARRLARDGFDLVLVSRDADGLSDLVDELHTYGIQVASMGGDATDERDVLLLFDRIISAFGIPSLVVYSLQEFGPGETLDITVPAFESAWRHNCFGAFLVSRAAGKAMKSVGSGSIILIGSTSSIIGRAGHLTLAMGKFGQRALAQGLARELWPMGIHVAHVMIDADISESRQADRSHPQSDPDDIARSVLAIRRQPKTAWSSEIDLRPWNEKFWEHC